MESPSDPVHRAFEAASIPPARWGKERLVHLNAAEQEFYRWILTSFGSGGSERRGAPRQGERARPERGGRPCHARTRGPRPPRPGEGAIGVAYPFSGRPTPHRVRLGPAAEANAMCAIDALGIPFMVGTSAEIVSLGPLMGEDA